MILDKVSGHTIRLQWNPHWNDFSVKIVRDKEIKRDEHSVYEVITLTHGDWKAVLECMKFMQVNVIHEMSIRRYREEDPDDTVQ